MCIRDREYIQNQLKEDEKGEQLTMQPKSPFAGGKQQQNEMCIRDSSKNIPLLGVGGGGSTNTVSRKYGGSSIMKELKAQAEDVYKRQG